MRIDVYKLIKNKIYCGEVFDNFVKKKILTKTGSLVSKRHLDKSINNIDFANFILTEHEFSIKQKLKGKTFYDWCITIYYYSIYHAVLALLAKAGYSSKNHLATITAITLIYYHKNTILQKEDVHFITEHIYLEKEEVDFIITSKDLREKACYGVDKIFELSQTLRLQKQTSELINKIRTILE